MPIEPDEISFKILAAFKKADRDDPARELNMWAVGEDLGIGRNEIQDLIMDLAAEGLLEIKSLSGNVILTEEGRNIVTESESVTDSRTVSDELSEFIESLEASLDSFGIEKEIRQNLEIDMSTLRGQLGRTKRLPAVLDATFKAIKDTLDLVPGRPADEIIQFLDKIISTKE